MAGKNAVFDFKTAFLLFSILAPLILALPEEFAFKFDCGGKAGCVTIPPSCASKLSCDLGVKLEGKDEHSVKATIVGKNIDHTISYIALGFSKDSKMGEDAVVACWNNDVKTLFNPANPGPGDHKASEVKEWKSGDLQSKSTSGGNDNKLMECSFQMPSKIDVGNGIMFDLMKDPVNVFVVSGPASPEGIRHHINRVAGNLAAGALMTSNDHPNKHSNDSSPSSAIGETNNLSILQFITAIVFSIVAAF